MSWEPKACSPGGGVCVTCSQWAQTRCKSASPMLIIPDIKAAACVPKTLLKMFPFQQHIDHSTTLCVLEQDMGSPIRDCHSITQPQTMTMAEECSRLPKIYCAAKATRTGNYSGHLRSYYAGGVQQIASWHETYLQHICFTCHICLHAAWHHTHTYVIFII